MCVCCVILCCHEHICELESVAKCGGLSQMPCVSAMGVCVCAHVCVSPTVYAYKTKALGVCVFVCCVCVSLGPRS